MKVHQQIVEVHDTRGSRAVRATVKHSGPEEVLDGINLEYLANLAWELRGTKTITIEVVVKELRR